MKGRRGFFGLVTTAVAGAILLPLVADWYAPGIELHLAEGWLGLGDGAARSQFPIWGRLVRWIGAEPWSLGLISAVSASLCAGLVAWIFGLLTETAIRLAEEGGSQDEAGYGWVLGAVQVLTGLAFVFPPSHLFAATHISPLMPTLVPMLATVALAAESMANGCDLECVIGLLRRQWWMVVLMLLFGELSVYDGVLGRRTLPQLLGPSSLAFLAFGVLPAILVAGCIRRRLLVRRAARFVMIGFWTILVAALMMTSVVSSGTLRRGRAVSRIVARVTANAGNRLAVLSEGPLDDLFTVMLPSGCRLISMSGGQNLAYGRELADWLATRPEVPEDVAFAAELGIRAFVREWKLRDPAGFETNVLDVAHYFPDRESWKAACEDLASSGNDEPTVPAVRWLLGVCGNHIGCRLLEAGDTKGAWEVFREVSERVDRRSYTAVLNQLGMLRRQLVATQTEQEAVERRRLEIEEWLPTLGRRLLSVRFGGPLCVPDPELEKAVAEWRQQQASEPLEGEEPIGELLAAASVDSESGRRARNAIRKALAEGRVSIDSVGGQLVTIDMALGDIASAEDDAIAVLRRDSGNPVANAVVGSLCGLRGEESRAERYLRRAVATGRASLAAKNDLACVLCQLGRASEAEPLAREAAKACADDWRVRETLVSVLLELGRLDEAEKELCQAEKLAMKGAGRKRLPESLRTDRMRLGRARKTSLSAAGRSSGCNGTFKCRAVDFDTETSETRVKPNRPAGD